MLLLYVLILACTIATIQTSAKTNEKGIPARLGKADYPPSERVGKRQAAEGLTSDEKQRILDVHNLARKNVWPRASSMKEMNWDYNLEQTAQDWSAKCTWAHNPQRTSNTVNYNYVGENMFMSYSTVAGSVNVEDAVTAWISEKKFYNYNSGCELGKVCGHYTQVIWADSEFIGCGRTVCEDSTIFVCNYGPGGNYVGQKPYMK